MLFHRLDQFGRLGVLCAHRFQNPVKRGVAAMQAAFASVSLASDCFVAPVAGPKAEVVE